MIDKLKEAWDNNDISTWIDLKTTMGRYKKDLGTKDPNFLIDMSLFNIKCAHKDEEDKHEDGWAPYCCSDKPCRSTSLDRMEKTDYGWYCKFCKNSIGKHLYPIYVTFYRKAVNFELKWSNVYGGVLLGNKKT